MTIPCRGAPRGRLSRACTANGSGTCCMFTLEHADIALDIVDVLSKCQRPVLISLTLPASRRLAVWVRGLSAVFDNCIYRNVCYTAAPQRRSSRLSIEMHRRNQQGVNGYSDMQERMSGNDIFPYLNEINNSFKVKLIF